MATSSRPNRQAIEKQADQLRKEYGFLDTSFDPVALARCAEIEVVANRDSQHGISGALIRVDEKFCILYATHIQNEGYQRFSISHELGHYFLAGHTDAVLKNGVHHSSAEYSSTDRYEKEADCFASCLLMPKSHMNKEMYKQKSGLEAVINLAGIFSTSLTATAFRYVELTSDPIVVCITSGDTIEQVFPSKAIKSIAGIRWIRNGEKLSKRTPTYALSIDPEENKIMDEESNLQDWFANDSSIKTSESAIKMNGYGKTLTVLTVDYDSEIEDEEDEQWEPPKFR